jgi:hypothetical protein
MLIKVLYYYKRLKVEIVAYNLYSKYRHFEIVSLLLKRCHDSQHLLISSNVIPLYKNKLLQVEGY